MHGLLLMAPSAAGWDGEFRSPYRPGRAPNMDAGYPAVFGTRGTSHDHPADAEPAASRPVEYVAEGTPLRRLLLRSRRGGFQTNQVSEHDPVVLVVRRRRTEV